MKVMDLRYKECTTIFMLWYFSISGTASAYKWSDKLQDTEYSDNLHLSHRGIQNISSNHEMTPIKLDNESPECVCDNLCQKFDNCCIRNSSITIEIQNSKRYDCTKMVEHGEIYFKRKCSPAWQTQQKDSNFASSITKSCENSSFYGDMTDPLGGTPVEGVSGTLYLNYFCAVCNNESSSNNIFWSRCIECPEFNKFDATRNELILGHSNSNAYKNSIASQLTFNKVKHSWGKMYDSNRGHLSNFQQCEINIVAPEIIVNFLEACSTVNNNSKSSENCSNGYLNGQKIVKSCGNNGTKSLQRFAHNFLDDLPVASFSQIFKLKNIHGNVMCNEKEIYDPYRKNCRNIQCGLGDFNFENGWCIQKGNTIGAKITFFCLCASNAGFVLHILATLLVKDLHNRSGLNICSLCFGLFGGFLLFIISPLLIQKPTEQEKVTTLCYGLAISMYFFFISSFCWMLVIALDIYNTLKATTESLRLINQQQEYQKVIYNISIGWLLPLTMVVVVILVDNTIFIPEMYKPHLAYASNGLCWFSDGMGLLIYFIIPFAAIMLSNILLFILSSKMIYHATCDTASTTACDQRTNFYLYLRLAIILGLTWCFALLAIAAESELLWGIFLTLNGLQGIFIFSMFTCTQKVMFGMKLRCREILQIFDKVLACTPGTRIRTKETHPVRRTDSTATTAPLINKR